MVVNEEYMSNLQSFGSGQRYEGEIMTFIVVYRLSFIILVYIFRDLLKQITQTNVRKFVKKKRNVRLIFNPFVVGFHLNYVEP